MKARSFRAVFTPGRLLITGFAAIFLLALYVTQRSVRDLHVANDPDASTSIPAPTTSQQSSNIGIPAADSARLSGILRPSIAGEEAPILYGFAFLQLEKGTDGPVFRALQDIPAKSTRRMAHAYVDESRIEQFEIMVVDEAGTQLSQPAFVRIARNQYAASVAIPDRPFRIGIRGVQRDGSLYQKLYVTLYAPPERQVDRRSLGLRLLDRIDQILVRYHFPTRLVEGR